MRLKVAEGTQVVADRIYAAGETFEVPEGFEEEAATWVRLGYATEAPKRTKK